MALRSTCFDASHSWGYNALIVAFLLTVARGRFWNGRFWEGLALPKSPCPDHSTEQELRGRLPALPPGGVRQVAWPSRAGKGG